MSIVPYKGRYLDVLRPVKVYRNLGAKLTDQIWSIHQDGLVVAHADKVRLRHCTFFVSPSQWQRARDSGKRSVHAWVKGTVHEHLDVRDYQKRGLTFFPFVYRRDIGQFSSPGKPDLKKSVLVEFDGGSSQRVDWTDDLNDIEQKFVAARRTLDQAIADCGMYSLLDAMEWEFWRGRDKVRGTQTYPYFSSILDALRVAGSTYRGWFDSFRV